jgi:hyperosmotically inducible periplasmic protein
MKLPLAILATMAMGAAHAQPSERFRSLDANGDGFLSREEARQAGDYERAFDGADDNRDGRISPDEFVKSEAIHERQRAGGAIDDTLVTAKVKAALLRERGIKSGDVKVETQRGRVLLSGFVDNEEQKQRAVNVASKVDGVREVRDGLNVR